MKTPRGEVRVDVRAHSRALVAMMLVLSSSTLFASARRTSDLLATDCYLSTHWDAGQGLRTNDLRTVLQTRDGYVWIGTSAGLVRFDGVRFSIYTKTNTPQMPSDDVTSLVEDSAGTLWISCLRGGIFSLTDGVFTQPKFADSLADAEVYSLFLDDVGALCACTSRGVLRIDDGQVRFVSGVGGVVRGGAAAPGGGYYLRGSTLQYCSGWSVQRTIAELAPGEGFTSVYPIADGSVLAGSSSRLEKIRPYADGRVERTEISSLRQVLAIIPFGPRRYLVGSLENGIRLVDGEHVDLVSGFDALRGGGRQVRCLARDSEGGIWATTPGGLYRFRRSFIRILGADAGITTEFAWTVRYTRGGTLWVGGGDKGTYRIAPDGARVYHMADGMPSEYVTAICEAADGSVLFGGMNDGLSAYRHGTLCRIDGYPGHGVYAIVEERPGRFLIGGGSGLYIYDGTKFEEHPEYGHSGGLAKVRTIIPDVDGTLWMVGAGRVYRARKGKLEAFEARDGQLTHQIMCIALDGPRVWAGSYGGGLYVLEGDSMKPVRPRGVTFGPRILSVHEDSAGYLWINAERELQRMRKSDLLRAMKDGQPAPRLWNFDHQDGLSNMDFSYVSGSSMQQLPTGQILYCSTNGIVVVDTRSVPDHRRPPPLSFEEIVADGVSYDLHGAPALPPGTRRIEIRFTAIQFDVPRRLRFRILTSALDHDWVEMDGLTRSVVYTSPSPGTYSVRLLASGMSGDEGANEASASFVVTPYLHETGVFRWGALLVVAGVLAGGYLARMRTMRNRQAALSREIDRRKSVEEQLRGSLEEKTVMLKEIHHRVKNNLQVISSLLNLQAGTTQDGRLRNELQESQQRIRTMALIHEQLYTSDNLARVGFKEYVETLVHQLARSIGRESIRCSVTGDNVMLSVGQAIPAALIVNELVTNALKHAFPGGRAGEIVVKIAEIDREYTEFSVIDDGRGLSPGLSIREAGTLGLQLVTTLTTQLEGALTVEGEKGATFRVRFKRD